MNPPPSPAFNDKESETAGMTPVRRVRWLQLFFPLLLLVIRGAAVSSAPLPRGPGSSCQEAAPEAKSKVPNAPEKDATQIRQLIAEYAKSVDDADASLASRVWWNSPDVSFINPVAHDRGFAQIKTDVYQHLMGETFSERHLSVHNVAIHARQNSAWAEFNWDFHAKLRKNGAPVVTHGVETQVYWKIQGRWRLVHVHYSVLAPHSSP